MIDSVSLKEDYDQTPYPALCFAQTHPDRLATLATLLGLEPAPVERCRVLELGCAVGGNILPMAYALPESEFTGMDISPGQIAAGSETAEQLGLRNIRFVTADIREITPDWGQYDFIIAHGVYSWVPAEVRDALLQVCRQNLTPQGIAYVSYNTFPGWHMLAAAREMMLYHARHAADPLEKAGRARELIDFLAQSIPERTDAYGSFLESYRGMIGRQVEKAAERSDALLLHDELESVNDPVYFHEFAAHAARHGLQYLTESEFSTVLPGNFKPETVQRLQQMSTNVLEMEQYMDFVRNRTFRQTLLCHQEQVVQRRLQPDPAQMARFSISSRAVPTEPNADMAGEGVVQFKASDGAELNTDHPVSKTAMMLLATETPRVIPFEELLARSHRRVYANSAPAKPSDEDALVLAANLLRSFTYSMRLVELHKYQPLFTTSVTERPLASAYARLQASRGELQVTNYLHERVSLDPVSLFLLPKLDGEHDQLQLALYLRQLAELRPQEAISGASVAPANTEVQSELPETELAQEVERGLEWLGRAALLSS